MADLPSTQKEVADITESPSKQVWKYDWGSSTLLGVFTGMLYYGITESRASASVSKDAGVMLKMGSTADKREQYRLMRDAMEKRFLRVARSSLVGGVRIGMGTGVLFGIANLLADIRGVHAYDVFNLVAASSINGSILFQVPGSLARRARVGLLGAVLGAGIGFPIGWLEMKSRESANQKMANSKSKSDVNEARERELRAKAE